MLTRRQFARRLALGTAAAGVALAMPRLARAKADTLRIMTWEGYAEADWVKPFEEKNGVKCKVVYTGSVDEMFAKVKGSKGADYDVIAFDTSSFQRYVENQLIQPIDPAKLKNAANLDPAFRTVPVLQDGDKRWGMPFAWGSLPLIYDKKAYPTAPDSWEILWDPQNAQQVISLDDANNCVVLAAMVLGIKDPFHLTDDQFAQVKAKLIAMKKNLLTYYAGYDDGVNIFVQNGIKAMFSMGEPQVKSLQKKGVDAAFTIPKEGAIGWLDCWTISAGAKDPDLAHAWIDACLDKAVGRYLTEKEGYGNTTDAAANQAGGMTYGAKLTFLETPEDFNRRVQLWNEVKAAQ
ncbi:MAG: extracellular solute-binding protein [Dongiaceae bacterium]